GALAAAGQARDVIRVEAVERLVEVPPGVGLVEHVAIGLARGGEAVRDQHAVAGELPVQLPERGVLAAHQRHVADAELLEEANVLELTHESPLSTSFSPPGDGIGEAEQPLPWPNAIVGACSEPYYRGPPSRIRSSSWPGRGRSLIGGTRADARGASRCDAAGQPPR